MVVILFLLHLGVMEGGGRGTARLLVYVLWDHKEP